MCNPTNEPLFDEDFHADMKKPNTCKPLTHVEVKAKGINIKTPQGELEFMYSGDKKKGFTFYKFDEGLKGYLPIDRSHEYWGDLYSKVSS